MKKKILILMPSMFIGGAERSLLGLLDSFDYDRYDVDLFLFRHEGEFLKYIPESVNILPEMWQYATFDVPIKDLLFSKRVVFGIARLLSKIAMKLHCIITKEPAGVWMAMQYISMYLQPLLPDIQGSYDAAISFLGVPDTLVSKVNAKVKFAWNHTDYTVLNPNKKRDLKVYAHVDYIVSVSEPCRESFLKVYPDLTDKAITIENTLSETLLRKQAAEPVGDMKRVKNEIHFLSIGRFSDAKNFDNVPQICRLLRQQGFNVKWFIIGYGGDENLIYRKIKEAGMQDYVIMLGKKENPYPYIKQCDLYVQPSRYEGKAVTVIEAQALHRPVVITKFATSSSQLIDGVDGVIVPLDNDGCADGIAKLLDDPKKMQSLSEACRRRDYSNQKEVEKLYELLR